METTLWKVKFWFNYFWNSSVFRQSLAPSSPNTQEVCMDNCDFGVWVSILELGQSYLFISVISTLIVSAWVMVAGQKDFRWLICNVH
jgi:hypothetical protein